MLTAPLHPALNQPQHMQRIRSLNSHDICPAAHLPARLQNGSVAEAISLWKLNVDKEFEGESIRPYMLPSPLRPLPLHAACIP